MNDTRSVEETEKSRFYPNEFNWWETETPCKKCLQPLHIASGQEFPFCPNCVIDARNAKRGRESLNALRARHALKVAKDRYAEEEAHRQARVEHAHGFWVEGMPL